MTRMLASLLVCAAAACGGSDSPTSPTPPAGGASTGTWAGPLADAINGTGSMRIDLSEIAADATRSLTTGTWAATFPATGHVGSGQFSGAITGGTFTAVFIPTTPPACSPATTPSAGSYTVTGTVEATTIRGTYVHAGCTTTVTGAITLQRQ